MKQILQRILAFLSRKILKKHKPIIIGITGSVGKTSAKEAIFHVVSQKFITRRAEKNFNNEFGVPFTILNSSSPGRNPFSWLKILINGLYIWLISNKYPEFLIVEMGIDRVGDMDYLLSIAHPNISIITSIGISHYEFFEDEAIIEKEKSKIATVLEKNEILIVNANDAKSLAQSEKTKGNVLSYGTNAGSTVKISDVLENLSENASTNFKVITPTKEFSAVIFCVGEAHLLSAGCAIAVAEKLKIETDLIIKGLSEYKPAPSRLSVISGIKKSIIIDDTYNASPDSTKVALNLLNKFIGSNKIAVLGDMLELGEKSYSSHIEIGQLVASLNFQKLVTVGVGGKLIAQSAKDNGMQSEHIVSFDSSEGALETVQNLIQQKSVILVKGSQGVRMEKITKEIMAEPMRAKELICRQYGKWLI